ncbi:hypothetical protein NKJ26_12230 [Mesorhizobium sp. M0152]|uniref:hypothetical protein n=1 Tax=Mesorhizobium sp. M0152 TaxID=2956898 RepID=UPI00333A477B
MQISVSGIAAFALTLTMAASAARAGERLDWVHKTGVVVELKLETPGWETIVGGKWAGLRPGIKHPGAAAVAMQSNFNSREGSAARYQ